MFEEQEEAPTLYTVEDMLAPPEPNRGQYPLLKEMGSIITKQPKDEYSIEYNSYLDGLWSKVNDDNIALDAETMKMSVSQGRTDVATEAARSIQARLAQQSQPTLTQNQKLREVAQSAAEDLAAYQGASILLNNSPEKVAKVTEEVASSMSSMTSLQQKIIDGNTLGGYVGMGAQWIMTGGGAIQNLAVQEIVNKYVGPGAADWTTGQEEDIQALKNMFASLPNDETKVKWLSEVYDDLLQSKAVSGMSPTYAGMVIGKIIENAPLDNWDRFTDLLNKVGLPAELFFAGAAVKTAKGILSAHKTAKATEMAAATLGAKELGVMADVKAIAKASGVVAGEVSGVSGIVSLAKLASSGIHHLLPEGITTAPTKLQEEILVQVNKTIKHLEETLGSDGKAVDAIDEIKKVYSPAINPTVARLDFGTTGNASLWFKPKDAPNFTTIEAAETWAKMTDPSGAMKLKVVPDTTNPGFLVSAEDLKAKEVELALAEAALKKAKDEATPKKPRKGSKRPVEATTEVGEGVAKGEDVKTPVEASTASKVADVVETPEAKSARVSRAFADRVGVTAAIEEGSKANKTPEEIYESIRKDVPDNFTLKNVVGTIDSFSMPKGDAPTGAAAGNITLFAEPLLKIPGNRTIGNITVSPNVPPSVGEFISKLGPALVDTHGSTRPLLVIQESDLLQAVGKEAHITILSHRTFVKSSLSRINGYFHVTEDGVPIIVMRNQSNRRDYMLTFAHEYAHYFVYEWGWKYKGELQSIFSAFLKSKKITTENIDQLTLVDLAEYRGVSFVRGAYKDAQVVDSFRYTPMWGDKEMGKWLNDFEEFFAENFSKWAFSDKLPTSLLGEYFSTMIRYIKHIFETFVSVFPGREPVNKQVAALMNRHVSIVVKDLSEGRLDYALPYFGEAKAARAAATPVQIAAQQVAALRAQIAAMRAATGGLTTGYLVAGTVVPKYATSDINSIIRINLGDWALGTSSEQYADRLVGTFQGARYQKLMTEFVRGPLEDLSRAERANVDSLLVEGDALGKEFTYAELLGRDVTAKEAKAYFTFRAARNMTYMLRNGALAKSLNGWGYSTLIHTGIPIRTFGRDVSPGSAVGFAWDADAGSITRVTEDWWRKNPTKVVKELPTPQKFASGQESWYVVAERNLLSETPVTTVIPYRIGEYKRSYTDPYFVKMQSSAYLNKDGSQRLVAHRTATTKADADAYVKAYNEGIRLHRAGQLTAQAADTLMQPWGWNAADFITEVTSLAPDAKMTSVYTRTEDDYLREGLNLGLGLGRERGDEVIANVRGGTNTLSPTDSLASEIGNTAYVASSTEWRDNHIKLWFNTFQDSLPVDLQKMSPEDAFFKHVERRTRYVGVNKDLLARQRIEDYLLANLRVPTAEEKLMSGLGRQAAELIEGRGNSKAMLLLGGLLRNTQDLPTFLRTVSFHSFFGFNPVQLAVQGMNAFNAIAISPVHGINAAGVMPFIRMALMSDQESIWRGIYKAKKGASLGLGMDVDEFVETVRSIKRSGLLDGINSTSLYGDKTGKMGIFNKLTRRVGEGSAFFFNRGEESSRIISFDIARREWKAAHPGQAWWTDQALWKIIERQDDLTQNMTIANTAMWQKGLLSVPTQYIQYQVKLLMNVLDAFGTRPGNLPRSFTRREATQLLTAHLLIMGTAGFWLWDWAREVLEEQIPEDWDAEKRLYVQQGIAAGVINSLAVMASPEGTPYSEAKMELGIGTRFGTFRFYEDFVSGLFDPEKTALEVLFGPSGGSITRGLDNFSKALSIFSNAPVEYSAFEEAAKYMLTGAFSAANNYNKAIIASAYDSMLSKDGQKLFAMNNKEQFMQKWGIPPAAQTDLTVLFDTSKKLNEFVKKESKVVSELRTNSLLAIRDGDDAKHRMYEAQIRIRLNGIPNDKIRMDIWKAAFEPSEQVTTQKKLMEEIMVNQFSQPNDALVTDNLMRAR